MLSVAFLLNDTETIKVVFPILRLKQLGVAVGVTVGGTVFLMVFVIESLLKL